MNKNIYGCKPAMATMTAPATQMGMKQGAVMAKMPLPPASLVGPGPKMPYSK